MAKWLYATMTQDPQGRWFSKSVSFGTRDLDEALQQMGAYDWELVTSETLSENGRALYIFKKSA
jgi:hypothetical protein